MRTDSVGVDRGKLFSPEQSDCGRLAGKHSGILPEDPEKERLKERFDQEMWDGKMKTHNCIQSRKEFADRGHSDGDVDVRLLPDPVVNFRNGWENEAIDVPDNPSGGGQEKAGKSRWPFFPKVLGFDAITVVPDFHFTFDPASSPLSEQPSMEVHGMRDIQRILSRGMNGPLCIENRQIARVPGDIQEPEGERSPTRRLRCRR